MRHALRFALLAIAFCMPATAFADGWVFARSYYSHDPVFPVEIGTPTSSRSYAPQYFRAFVQGGYRYSRNSSNLRSNFGLGRYFEAWRQVGPHN